jgi:ribulose-5-phosphate 4-epimerase/fuculose-1-phosphate aldolase
MTTATTAPVVELKGSEAVGAVDGPSGLGAAATGGYPFAGIPNITDPYKKRQWQLEHMAGAFRVFARKGFTEGTSGHISVRDPVDPSTFWINPLGVHFGMLKASDMVHINEEGQVIGGNRVAVNAAGFVIHSAIHRARPDVHAACHMHSPAGKAWSAFGRPVDIINQDSCNFYGTQAVYHDFGGVVLGEEEGRRIVKALGDKNRVIFLQNHGLLTTGGTVDEAAYLFTCLERTCEVQLMVEAAGLPKHIISDEAATYTAKVNADPVSLSCSALDATFQARHSNISSRKLCTRSSSRTLSLKSGSPRAS